MCTYFLDLQPHYTPWELPTLPEVIHSIRAKYPHDPKLAVIADRTSMNAVYKIILNVDTEGDLSIPVKIKNGEEHVFPLVNFASSRLPRAQEVLHTLYDSTLGLWQKSPTMSSMTSLKGNCTEK